MSQDLRHDLHVRSDGKSHNLKSSQKTVVQPCKMRTRTQLSIRNATIFVSILLLRAWTRSRYMKNRKIWAKKWISHRRQHGHFHSLLECLRLTDADGFKNFTRLDASQIEVILQKISPMIRKQETMMRSTISPHERLIVTLRFLATGASYVDLQYNFRLGKSTIGLIIPECCYAIYSALKSDYLQVSFSI